MRGRCRAGGPEVPEAVLGFAASLSGQVRPLLADPGRPAPFVGPGDLVFDVAEEEAAGRVELG
ncbi:hypothetical protein Adu01nite_81250 [Paractinoplanes durhamensis]|uniref:Uncharacterized protein n=1 Tax=Paractinoplanes durhamensis TaxID=113563 RepID=A0ABQ3ZAB3_9ACTN|nr:hypothetical protein Adu01nite_81250 [Actinoplanes durhamensis]